MKTSTDIAIMVRNLLVASNASLLGSAVSWQRHGYEKTCEIVVVPHFAQGEESIRRIVVMVNVHVPDIYDNTAKVYETDFSKLNTLTKAVIDALKDKIVKGCGISWEIESVGQPTKEPEYNEHFTSVSLYAYVRQDN